MKVAYVIFVRNKAHLADYLVRCVKSAFAQTYSPMEIILSDQGSTDGTRELLEALASEYKGPNTVRVLDCPDTAMKGMAGMNAHFAWLHAELDADIIVPAAGDDYAEPDRTAVLIEAFERTGADMVGAAMYFADPGAKEPAGRSSFAREGWVTVEEVVVKKVGGSSAPAWRRSLWERMQPIPGLCGVDVFMPPIACVLGGFYYVNKPLYTYVNHADVRNTGLEGVMRALPEAERKPVDEHRFFQTAGAWQWVLRRMTSLGVGSAADRQWVAEAAMAHYEAWLDTRTEMTVRRIAPLPFPT
jgi:glycosyltransferase involved in cell wall biosynthesis